MTENKRFKRVHAMRYGQIGITDELHNCGDKWFPKNLTEDETVDLLNKLNDENEQFHNLARDYNIPLSKLGTTFEDFLNSDTVTDLESQIAELRSKVDDKTIAVETATEEQMLKVFTIIDEKILECEKAVEDIRYNGKDSYIVKHDVASKILKDLKEELKE